MLKIIIDQISCCESVSISMASFLSRCLDKVKSWIHWSWTYLWAVWFMLVIFVVYILRGPLKLSENLSYGKSRGCTMTYCCEYICQHGKYFCKIDVYYDCTSLFVFSLTFPADTCSANKKSPFVRRFDLCVKKKRCA